MTSAVLNTSRSFLLQAIVAFLSVAASVIVVHVLFGMRWWAALALYFVIWWTVIFAILPIGVRSQAETGDITAGTEPGAPTSPHLVKKALWTTMVTSGLLVIAMGVVQVLGI